jgi:hypothetical protein
VGDITGRAAIESYVVTDDTSDYFSFYVGTDTQNVTAASTTDSVTFDVGGRTYAGTLTGDNGGGMYRDSVRLTNGGNIAAATLVNVGGLNVDSNASATLTAAQYASFASFGGGINGPQTIIFTTAFATEQRLWGVYETYVLAAGNNFIKTDDSLGMVYNADALSDADLLTLTGSNKITITLTAGDLAAGSATGKITVTATTGSNVITTGSAIDTIYAGAGADTITGGANADTLNGEAGDDIFIAEDTDIINGGADMDTVHFAAAVSAGNLTDGELVDVEIITITNTGNATYDFSAQTETLTISGGTGNDVINSGSGNNTITGGAGVDNISIGGGVNTIVVSTVSTTGVDVVTGLTSNDFIKFYEVGSYFHDTDDWDSAADLADALSQMLENHGGGNGQAVGFYYGGNSYVFIDSSAGSSGNYLLDDAVVQLAGVDLGALTRAMFIS